MRLVENPVLEIGGVNYQRTAQKCPIEDES